MFSKQRITLFLILLVGFIDLVGLGLVYPMFSALLFQPGCLLLPEGSSDLMKGSCLGILLAAMPLTQFFSAPFLGALSDQKGRRKVLIPALGFGVVGYAIAIIGVHQQSLFILLLSRLLVGISAGTAAIVSAALADISPSKDKAKNFALLNMACGLGFTVGPFFGGMLSEVSFSFFEEYTLPFAFAGTITLLNLVLAYFFFEETFVPKLSAPLSLTLTINNIKKAYQGEKLRYLFLAIFLGGFGFSFYWEFAPATWIGIYGFNTSTIGKFYAYGAAIYALSCGILIRPIIARFSNETVLCYAMMLCGLSIGMLLFHTDEAWLWVYISLQQFAAALFWPTAAAVVSDSCSEEIQGEMLGVLHSVDALAFAVGPLIAGPLLGLTPLMPLIVGSLVMLLSSLVLGLFHKGKDKEASVV
jgi:DHA1 family tetracycline resistance protein-like MFS transporter